MTWTNLITLFTPWDFAAVAFLLVAWVGIGFLIDRSTKRPSVSTLAIIYRREWMTQMLVREPRMFDSQILGLLRQGTAFFASTCMIAIGGALALIGNAERLAGIAEDLTDNSDPVFVWEVKLLVVILFMANGFLKFVWSHRLFGYCAVLMAAVPVDPTDPAAVPRATQTAELNITAARSYNRGLRSVDFAMTAAAWLLGAIPLILATLYTIAVLYRREFASQSREIMLLPDAAPAKDTETR